MTFSLGNLGLETAAVAVAAASDSADSEITELHALMPGTIV